MMHDKRYCSCNEKVSRNQEILTLYKQGMSLEDLADKYNISYQRVRIILKELKEKELSLQDENFALVLKHCLTYVSGKRVYNALMSSGYVRNETFKTDILKLNLSDLRSADRCGKRVVAIVRDVQNTLKKSL